MWGKRMTMIMRGKESEKQRKRGVFGILAISDKFFNTWGWRFRYLITLWNTTPKRSNDICARPNITRLSSTTSKRKISSKKLAKKILVLSCPQHVQWTSWCPCVVCLKFINSREWRSHHKLSRVDVKSVYRVHLPLPLAHTRDSFSLSQIHFKSLFNVSLFSFSGSSLSKPIHFRARRKTQIHFRNYQKKKMNFLCFLRNGQWTVSLRPQFALSLSQIILVSRFSRLLSTGPK